MDYWKLIELLNKYEENRPMELPRQYRRKEMPTFKWWLVAVSEYDDEMVDNSDLLVISKFNWFIKWLVEKDKIDNDKLEMAYENEEDLYIEWDVCSDYRFILMLLTIQDEPIDFLIEILK